MRSPYVRRKIAFLCIVVILLLVIFTKYITQFDKKEVSGGVFNDEYVMMKLKKSEEHNMKVEVFLEHRKLINMSELGRVLFTNSDLPEKRSGTFKILIWKDGPFLERRHIRYFQTSKHDPFERCSVNNCILTYEATDVENADAVVFLLHRLSGQNQLPINVTRPATQRWIFLTDESPYNTFLQRKNNSWHNYNGIFNWSMSYKMESDVPVPYGRTLPINEGEIVLKNDTNADLSALIPHFQTKSKDALAAIMTSNCGTYNVRMLYVHELQKHMEIDIYGGCGKSLKNACPGHFGADCPKLNNYMFYLAFENSDCDQYITEKVFWNALEKGSVPIIMGTHPKVCQIHLPPNSYIHVNDFARPLDLARYLIYLSDISNGKYLEYHKWRKDFYVINEHGYFGNPSVHYCRICEALNYNSLVTKTYDDLSHFLDPDINCVRTRNLR